MPQIRLLTALVAALVLSAGPPMRDLLVLGTVTNAETGQPLDGVQVSVEGTTAGTLSAGGAYRLTVPRSALSRELVVTARLLGYVAETRRVSVSPEADSVRVDLALRPEAVELGAAVAGATIRIRGASGPVQQRLLPPGYNREAYAHIEENEFLEARGNPLSTFAVDVDRASYANTRRFIMRGQRPPRDAVRIEELVNYFDYDYPEPAGAAPFSLTTGLIRAPWQPEHYLLRVGLKAPAVDVAGLPPSNLVFLLDVSGSMQSYDKLPLLKRSFGLLVDQLRPEDRVAIVVYAGASGLVLESTPGDRREEIRKAIGWLEAGGSTAGAAGIRLAYQVGREHRIEGGNNRVILATDGDFNIGVSSESELIQLIERERESGIYLTVLGFGTGNLQDSKMEALADHGNGNYAYVDRLSEARKVLVSEMGGTLVTVAKDVKIQVEFNPAVVAGYRLIGYENRLLAAEDFEDDTKDAGEIGAGHTVTALYEIVPVGAASGVELRSSPELRYSEPAPGAGPPDELAYVNLRYKAPDGDTSRLLERPVANRLDRESPDIRFAAGVAAFGMLLRGSEHCGTASLPMVLRLTEASADRDEHRAGFVELVRMTAARELVPGGPDR